MQVARAVQPPVEHPDTLVRLYGGHEEPGAPSLKDTFPCGLVCHEVFVASRVFQPFQVPAVRLHTVCLQIGGPSQRDGVAVRDPAVFDDETPCLPGFLLLQSAGRGQLLFPDAGIEEQQVVGDAPGFLEYGFTCRFLDEPDEGIPAPGRMVRYHEGGYPVVRTQFQTEVLQLFFLGTRSLQSQLFQPRGHIIFLC